MVVNGIPSLPTNVIIVEKPRRFSGKTTDVLEERDSQLGSSIGTIDSERDYFPSMENSLDNCLTETEHPYATDENADTLIPLNPVLVPDNPLKEEPKRKSCAQSSLGVFLGLLSGFANSLVALLVKLINSIGTFEIAVFRYVIMLGPLLVALGMKRTNPFRWELVKTRGWVLVLRAVVGSASTYCKYFALHKLPLADASVILFSSPVFTSLLARIFLKEKFHWIQGVAIGVTLAGCTLVSRPTFIFGASAYNPNLEWDDHMWGCIAALASAVSSASVFVTVRHMKDVDSTIVLFWTAFVGLFISLIATATLDHFVFPTDWLEIIYILGVGILTLVSQEALTRALRLESAGLISLLRTGDIVWSFVWQITLFRIIPHYFSIIGALLVVFCVMFISLREAGEKMPANSKVGQLIRKINRKMDAIDCTACCKKKKSDDTEEKL